MREFKLTERYTPRQGQALQRYMQDLEKCKVISADQEADLVNRAKDGDLAAKEKLIKANLRFVVSVAKAYTRDPDVFQELVSVGNIGLAESLDTFDPTKGFKFISYAVWHIRKEMLNYLSSSSRMIRLPSNRSMQTKAIYDAGVKISVQLGREPTTEEVLEYLKESGDERFNTIDMDAINAAIKADPKPHSLDAMMSSSDDSTTWGDMIPSATDSPDLGVSKDSASNFLRSVIRSLSESEQEIITRYYGLNTGEMESFASIGEKMGISGERARQKYNQALLRLKGLVKRRKISISDFTS